MRSAGLASAVVDGQRLVLPDAPTLTALVASPALDGRPVGIGRLLARYVALAERFSEIRVALGEAREADKPWIVLHLLEAPGGELVRVHLESQVCPGCGASRVTGLARHYNLYEGAPDPWASLGGAAGRATVACPGCGAAYPQPPVWVAR